MQYKDLAKLEALRKRNGKGDWVNNRLYRMMYMKDLYVTAYERIKSKPGNMTPGADGSTLDSFSIKTIDNIIGKMQDESFMFSRARRVHIVKPQGGTRPLGIAPPTDKVVQEVMRMILESIYDSPHGPIFSDDSHGFRPGRSCHTALKQVRRDWSGVTWVIEGDIKSFFDTIDHDLLIEILKKRISDERFLNLVRKSLKAGYLEFNVPIDSDFGTPQGSILSPLLANIFLHELDKYMEKIKDREEKGKGKKANPAYKNISYHISKTEQAIAVSEGNIRENLVDKLHKLKTQMRNTPSLDPKDGNFIRIKYVRYADDWMVGVNGPKELAVNLRDELSEFLDGMKLKLSMEKTHIRHAKSEEAFFLGTRIKIGHQGQGKVTQITTCDGRDFKKRTTGWTPALMAPVDKLVKRLHDKGFCDAKGFPLQKNIWTVLDDDQIVSMFNSVLLGITNYYSFALNYSELNRIQYILKFSTAKTLATKHRSSIKKVFAKHGDRLTVKSKAGNRISLKLIVSWKANSRRFMTGEDTPDIYLQQWKMRTRSKLGLDCVICGGWEDIEMHHTRSIRKMGQKVVGFDRILQMINRKQIPVCMKCHKAIHSGIYDGIALSSFVDPAAAAA